MDKKKKQFAVTASSKSNVWIKQNGGVSARPQKDVEQVAEEENNLDKVKRKLEEKAKLYEQMTKGDFPGIVLSFVTLMRRQRDFSWWISPRRLLTRGERIMPEDRESSSPNPPPENPGEEWVDYVDALGQSRKCMKKDLPVFKKMDQDFQGKGRDPAEKDLLSEDMRRELKRWEREEEEAMNRPVGLIHYEDIREQEARELGVGYFAFSQDQEQRRKRKETLDMLRDQTTDQCSKREQLKEKRKDLLNAWLAKVRQRKMKKTKLDRTEDDQGAGHNQEEEEDLIGPLPPSDEAPVEAPAVKKVVEIQERRDTKPEVPHIREWDRGKVCSPTSLPTPVPPSIPTSVSQQTQIQPQCPPQPQTQPPSQSLDDMLSFYKNSA
ncbi:unnamed protein product [Coregonus sp. 'balchen']|nr:unnamed protein product [Coregonus sp. 'balchen']